MMMQLNKLLEQPRGGRCIIEDDDEESEDEEEVGEIRERGTKTTGEDTRMTRTMILILIMEVTACWVEICTV